MKKFLIILALIAAFILVRDWESPIGTDQSQPITKSKADYVRENHCARFGDRIIDSSYFDGGSVHLSRGWQMYHCPNGVYVSIDNGEDQP